MSPGMSRVIGIVRPCIGFLGLGMAFQVEYLDGAIPNGLTMECLFDRDAFGVLGLSAVELMDYVLKFFYVSHFSASNKSRAVVTISSTDNGSCSDLPLGEKKIPTSEVPSITLNVKVPRLPGISTLMAQNALIRLNLATDLESVRET